MGKKTSKLRKEFVKATKVQNEDGVDANHNSQSDNEGEERVNGIENIIITQEVPEFVPDIPINEETTDEELEIIEHVFNAKDENPNIPKEEKSGRRIGSWRQHGGSPFRDCSQ
ncbi:hypothetical protein TSUD_217840 [Trifolium subterraneum]|uniref:Uncharacterized protein n=1 Tax=Trifolium subterraneum TaxID=3900 RepID=A0A2Z6MUX4_TRISU|nr:hypothetical protein TSUD_217840 [Trifolium subterraneum]